MILTTKLQPKTRLKHLYTLRAKYYTMNNANIRNIALWVLL